MLPLLHKELTELAAHRRLYALRVVWAVVLCLTFALSLSTIDLISQDSQDPLGLLGQGRTLLVAVFWAEVVAILVLMPAFTAGVLTHERESGSLVLLLLTPLGIWRMLLEKWLSRIVAVGSFLLMGLPLMAIAYAYGGFEAGLLLRVAGMLAVTCLQVSAVSLLVSAWSRSTVGAFVGVLLILPAYYLLPWIAMGTWNLADNGNAIRTEVLLFPWSPWNLFIVGWIDDGPSWIARPVFTSIHLLMIGASILVPLLLARLVVVRRSLVSGPGLMARAFHGFDRWSEAVDARWGLQHGGVLDIDQPVAWRARRNRAMTGLRYQVRLVLGGVVVVTPIGVMAAAASHGIPVFQGLLTAVAMLMLVIHGASLFAGERQDQTLQVLLTSPMTTRAILAQKLVGLRRIHGAMLVVMLPLFGIFLLVGDMYVHAWDRPWNAWTAGADALLMPALAAWLGIYVGLHVQRRQRAIVLALVVLMAWMVGGGVIAGLLSAWTRLEVVDSMFLPFFSPLFHPLCNGMGNGPIGQGTWTTGIHFAWNGLVLLGLRWWCFRIVGTHLHR